MLVILNHSISLQTHDKLLFCVWGEIAVPMFLLIQVFHSYKHGTKKYLFSFKKTWNRILKYFFIAQVSIIATYSIAILIGGSAFYGFPFFEGDTLINFFRKVALGLGIGAGSYYVYIYIEFAMLLYIIRKIVDGMKMWQVIVTFLLLSEVFELLSSILVPSPEIYRLLFIRYTFLLGLGILITRRGVILNRRNFLLSIISIGFVIFFNYTDINLQPFIFMTKWKLCHWMCYFYIANYYIIGLYLCYCLSNNIIKTLTEKIGKYSLEVYIVQMMYFSLPIRYWMESIMPHKLASFLLPPLSVVICTSVVIGYKHLRTTITRT